VGILALMAAAIWLLVLSPRLGTAADFDAQTEQADFENIQLMNRYRTALELADQAPQAAAEAQRVFSLMPQEAELPAVLKQITDAATQAGILPVDIRSLSTSLPTPFEQAPASGTARTASGVNLARIDVTLTATGTHRQLIDFIVNLEGLSRPLLLTSATLSTPTQTVDQPIREELQVQGSMFILQSQLPDLVAQVKDLLASAQSQGVQRPAIPPSGGASPSASAPR
jgi:hypothetical protein